MPSWSVGFYTAVGLAVGICAVFGDLFESVFKRIAGIKVNGHTKWPNLTTLRNFPGTHLHGTQLAHHPAFRIRAAFSQAMAAA